ncbi:hypothetical protein [Crinalium epipsammum]|uniref:hypothetical protein n=1 Tax=Crinalium epipsammum TaxID=241425 RepID=UPI0012FA2B34|nr:hypothetical protein [Crinalium epipsammum]
MRKNFHALLYRLEFCNVTASCLDQAVWLPASIGRTKVWVFCNSNDCFRLLLQLVALSRRYG